MVNSQMSVKERMIASINMQPVDRLAFWPKLSPSYPPARKLKFKKYSVQDFFDYMDSEVQKHIKPCVKVKRFKTSYTTRKHGNKTVHIYNTPYGEVKMVMQFDKASHSSHPMEYPIKTAEDIKVMTEFYNDAKISLDKEILEENYMQYKKIGDDALACVNIGISPFMDFIQHHAGIENAHYLLHDNEKEVQQLFKSQLDYLCEIADILAEYSPADVIYMVENTSTTLLTPKQYSNYCFKHINKCGKILKDRNRIMALHMCGHLKDLLPVLSKSPASMFEAFTSPPVGNTSLLVGRTICKDKCLFGGTNATLWLEPADIIIQQIKHDLDELPHHRGIMLSSAGVMPPSCNPETIKKVCDFIHSYKIKA